MKQPDPKGDLMKKTGVFTRILAIVGTLLAWFPLLTPVILGLASLVTKGQFLFDYLMPAELFPAALLGSALLLWAAFRGRAPRKLIGWGLALAVLFLLGSQGLAVVTGLASGETSADGWPWVLVLTMLGLFTLALLGIAVGGILLLRDLARAPDLHTAE
jgi:hypothetical protein